MDTFLLRVHEHQVAHQCRAALIGFNVAQQGLSSGDQDLFWAGIQAALTACANVSKTLWGATKKVGETRRPIRDALGVSDDDPLASRTLRNHLEHFDERIDKWYATSTDRNYVDFVIGPKATSIVGPAERDMFRHFDPETGEVWFWGEVYAIQPLIDAVERLLPVVEIEAQKPHWTE